MSDVQRYRTFVLAHDEAAVGSEPMTGRLELTESWQLLSTESPMLDQAEQVDWDGDIHSGRVLCIGVFVGDRWETMGRKELDDLMANVHDEQMAPAQP